MITAIVLAKNEEKNITDCLKRLSWCDEVIVIDDNSTDNTKKLVQENGAIVFAHFLESNFSKQRNFGLSKAKGEWVLFIDADERIEEPLQNEIQQVIGNASQTTNGFFIQRIDYMWDKQLRHGETGNKKFLRLARKNKGEWVGSVHEEWKITGKIEELNSPLLHYPHSSVSEFLKEINFYTDLRAKELYEQRVKVNFFSIILYPKAKFITNYFFKLGFLDGIPGLLVSLFMAFHSFLVRGKLWQHWQKK